LGKQFHDREGNCLEPKRPAKLAFIKPAAELNWRLMIAFLRRLWTFVRPYRTRLVMGLICGLFLAFANGMLLLAVRIGPDLIFHGKYELSTQEQIEKAPRFFQPLLEWLASHLPTSIQASSNGILYAVILSIPVIMFLRSLFSYLNVYLVNWASTRAMADLRTAVFSHLQNLPLSFFSQANTGDLIARVSIDTQSLRGIVGSSIATLVSDPFTILMVAVMLLSMQPTLTLFSIVVLPVCIIPVSIYAKKVRQSAKAMQTHTADLSKVMHEAFTGNRIIKAYNLEDKVLAEFREVTRKFVGQTMRVVRAGEIPGNVTEFLGGLGVTLILLYIANAKSSVKDIGHFSAFLFGMFSMYKPIKNLTRLHNQFHQAHAASHRVFELLDTPSSMPEPASPKPLVAANADIQFDDVHFSYGDKPVLKGINLTIKAGQFVALVGTTGSGKTSLVNLLPRFYDVQSGAVLIGGLDVREVSLKELRQQVAIVTQETILFHDTIRNNIAVGRPGATRQDIEAAAHSANAHEFIMQKEQGYDTIVGEKGVTLSGGQKQRVSIARALLKDAPILILDEAMNSLDNEVERAVQEELEKLMEGRTTICIAHRLSTVCPKADRIVVMSDGQIAETGTHTELIERRGVYWRLYELEFQTQK
jgi:subfamily B ATP-binding cassette protein MsbA